MALYHEYGGENCLQPVNVNVINQLMEAIGDDTLQFVTLEYAQRAHNVFRALDVKELSFLNVWVVFQKMLPKLST